MRMAAEEVADGSKVTQAHWNSLFRRLDRDGSGTLDRKEFYSFVRDTMRMEPVDYPDDAIWEVFKALDHDMSSMITIGELVAFAENTMDLFHT